MYEEEALKAAAEAIQLPKNFGDVSFLKESHSNYDMNQH